MAADRDTDEFLRANPDFAARLEEYEQRIAAIAQRCAPVLDDLRRRGVDVIDFAELDADPKQLPRAVPVLIEWLHRTDDDELKIQIAWVLAHREAGVEAARGLIEEFGRVDPARDGDGSRSGVRDHIGTALEQTASDAVAQELIDLALDRSHGRHRSMVVLALGSLKRYRDSAVEALVSVLDDDSVVIQAVMALGRLRAVEAIPAIEVLAQHPDLMVRSEVGRTLRKLTGHPRPRSR